MSTYFLFLLVWSVSSIKRSTENRVRALDLVQHSFLFFKRDLSKHEKYIIISRKKIIRKVEKKEEEKVKTGRERRCKREGEKARQRKRARETERSDLTLSLFISLSLCLFLRLKKTSVRPSVRPEMTASPDGGVSFHRRSRRGKDARET